MTISIGPLAMPVAPVKLLIAFLLASWLAKWLQHRTADNDTASREPGKAVSDILLNALLLGLLAGRLVFVAQNYQAYLSEPWAVLDIRDGGWNVWAALVFGIVWVAWRQHAMPTLRMALVGGTGVGLAIWLVASQLLSKPQPLELPNVALVELASGRTTALRQVSAGRPRVINLWASWCGPCRQEMPTLAAAQQREKGVDFLFINAGESAQVVQAYLNSSRLPLGNVWLDAQSEAGAAMGSRGLPTTLFVDASGRLVDAHMGALNGPALASKLQQIGNP
jgi:thiol-disulfide isomerase/thioredoxin